MKFCPDCGYPLSDDLTVCPNCNTVLEDTSKYFDLSTLQKSTPKKERISESESQSSPATVEAEPAIYEDPWNHPQSNLEFWNTPINSDVPAAESNQSSVQESYSWPPLMDDDIPAAPDNNSWQQPIVETPDYNQKTVTSTKWKIIVIAAVIIAIFLILLGFIVVCVFHYQYDNSAFLAEYEKMFQEFFQMK